LASAAHTVALQKMPHTPAGVHAPRLRTHNFY